MPIDKKRIKSSNKTLKVKKLVQHAWKRKPKKKNVISVSKPFRIKRESENVLSNVQGFHTDSTMREEGIQNKEKFGYWRNPSQNKTLEERMINIVHNLISCHLFLQKRIREWLSDLAALQIERMFQLTPRSPAINLLTK